MIQVGTLPVSIRTVDNLKLGKFTSSHWPVFALLLFIADLRFNQRSLMGSQETWLTGLQLWQPLAEMMLSKFLSGFYAFFPLLEIYVCLTYFLKKSLYRENIFICIFWACGNTVANEVLLFRPKTYLCYPFTFQKMKSIGGYNQQFTTLAKQDTVAELSNSKKSNKFSPL